MANSKKGTAQVNPPTPMQRVAAAFGGKAALVDEIMSLIGERDGDVRSRLLQVSNKRLISHHHNAKRMVAEFGSRDGLIDAICAKRYPKGTVDENFRTKIEGYSAWRLMDLSRQVDDNADRSEKNAAMVAKRRLVRRKRRETTERRRTSRSK
jgi:hypothetical protein